MKQELTSLVEEALKEVTDIAYELRGGRTFQQINWHYRVRVILTDLATKASQNVLQPLPKEIPYGFVRLFSETHTPCQIWKYVIKHFGTPPPEWWHGLKKGDKFVDKNGEIREYSGIVFLDTDNGGGIICPVHLCSPYTPTALEQFMQSLTPEQLELAKKLKIEEGEG